MRAAGFAEAADEMEVFAKQEGHHGELMAEILARYPQAEKKEKAKKVYVCPVCGYEYEGGHQQRKRRLGLPSLRPAQKCVQRK